jgi:integrase
MECPCACRLAIFAALMTIRALPSFFPFARAFRRPARTRSTIKLRSNSATAPNTVKMTPRVRGLLETRWEAAGKPTEGWVWPAPTRNGHVESSSLKKQHAKAFRTLREEATRNNEKPVRPFVLYSLRHTFLTRLGESGCDAWTLARIAGHSNISMSSRYVHPSEDAVLTATERLGGHKIGHSKDHADSRGVARRQLTQ